MPEYDYKCDHCDHIVQEIRSIHDDTELVCGGCGDPMHRIITSCNFILQGNGWTGRDTVEKKERIERSKKMKTVMKDKESAGHFQ